MPALVAAAASVVNGTVNSLMQNKMYKAEAERTKLLAKLDGLDSSEKFYLALKLQEAKTDTERYAILKDRASKIDVATLETISEYGKEAIKQRGKEAQTTAIIIGSAVILLIAAFVVIYKRK